MHLAIKYRIGFEILHAGEHTIVIFTAILPNSEETRMADTVSDSYLYCESDKKYTCQIEDKINEWLERAYSQFKLPDLPKTYRELVELSEPERINEYSLGGVRGCPDNHCILNCHGAINDERCRECWNQCPDLVKENG